MPVQVRPPAPTEERRSFDVLTAATITIPEALHLLDTNFAELASGVGNGEYALWLGSGISRGRVVALNGVLRKLIEFLRVRASPTDPSCPYRTALDQIIDKATLSAEQKARTDYGMDSATWPDLPTILARLAEKYSRVLDVTVTGHAAQDFLLWEGVDFVNTFADQEPDAEHLCVTVLAAEGVATEIVSANWDGLLESAAQELGFGSDIFRICVTGSDFRGPVAAARLLKFHGCALRAIENEGEYRPLLIARYSQIVNWAVNTAFTAMRGELTSVAARMRTLMVGMSAQDTNIQQIFHLARERTPWPWNDAAPPHVFAEDQLGEDQQTILRTSYGDEYPPNQAAIHERACFRAYGKPLLIALVLHVLYGKLKALLATAEKPHLDAAAIEQLKSGLKQLRDAVALAAGDDKLDFVRTTIRHFARGKTMLQEGRVVTSAKPAYRAVSNRPAHHFAADANIGPTGQAQTAGALAVLGLGLQDGDWTIKMDDPSDIRAGALRARSTLSDARVIFVANGDVDLRLFNDGTYAADDEDVVIVHALDVREGRKRSPSKRLRGGKAGPRHVSMGKLLRTATSIDDLRSRFRQEAGL